MGFVTILQPPPRRWGMSNTTDLKREVLVLTQWLAPDEQLTAIQAARSLEGVVAGVFASNGITPVQMALVALRLAQALDAEQQGGGG